MPTQPYSVLNVQPQSQKQSPNRPRYRREVVLDDHYQTWLVNYNEIRDEVNRATATNTIDSIVYRDNFGNFAANTIAMNSMSLNTPGGGPSPVSMTPSGITIQSPATFTVNAGATFSNTTTFAATSSTYFNGPLVSNSVATFNATSNFDGQVNLSANSNLKVDGPSTFTSPVLINAPLNIHGDLSVTGNNHIFERPSTTRFWNLVVDNDLTVHGNNVSFNVGTMEVEDQNIVVNKGGANTENSGIYINQGMVQDKGFFRVSSDSEAKLEFKPPEGNILTIEMPVQDVTLRLDSDFTSDQGLLTTSNVAFRQIHVDTSFSKHDNLPSRTHNSDAIAGGKGYLSSPWIYTNSIESYASASLLDSNTSGIFIGSSPYAYNHQVAMATFGESRMLIDRYGKIGMSTITPVEDLHLSREEPTLLLSTTNFDKKARLALSDLSEDYDSAGMHITFDANTGSGVVEVTPLAINTSLSLSVGGFEKTPEIEIKRNQVKIDTDLYVTQNGYVANEFAVDHTMFVRSHTVGINVINPAHALDVSGNIHGDSDLLLTGVEPFVQIGTVTTLESMGRSGLVIEEETPVIQLSTNSSNYRHGSQIYFNDAVNDNHWSMGTVLSGSCFDFGRSNSLIASLSANTPEHGLDEYFGDTLMRFEGNRLKFFVEGISDSTTAAMTINTRTPESAHLYLGEKETVYSGERDSTVYTANTISSAIQWHGDDVTATIGEQTYFPQGNSDGEFGSFRFSRVGFSINKGAPNAKVGVGQLYAHENIGVNQTTPTTSLHITDSHAGIIAETPGGNQKFSLTSDATHGVKMKGEDVGGSSFSLQAQNPSQFDLISDNCSLLLRTDGTADTLQFELKDSDTNAYVDYHIQGSGASLSVEHPTKITELTKTTKFENKVQFLDSSDQYIEETKNGSLIRKYKKDIGLLSISSEFETPTSNTSLHLSSDKIVSDWQTTSGQYGINLTVDGAGADTQFTLKNDTRNAGIEQDMSDSRFYLKNNNNDLILKNLTTGNTEFSFSGTQFEFSHTNPTANTLYTAYCDHIDFETEVKFNNNVTINGDFVSSKGISFPINNPNNKIQFNMTSGEGVSNSNNTSDPDDLTDYIGWFCEKNTPSVSDGYAQIYFSKNGDTSVAWGGTNELLPTTRLCLRVGNEGDEGIEIKSTSKQLTYFYQDGLYTNIPIKQTHTGTLLEYEPSDKWILKEGTTGVDSGIYWNRDNSASAYYFSNNLDEYTNSENEDNQFVFVQNGTPRAAIDLDTGSFRTAGDVVADNDIIGFVTSDITYKENIKLLKNPLEMIDGIRGVNFDWKENPSGYAGQDIGVIAQEIEQIIPEAVRIGGNGQKQVNYEKIIPLLIECIKELKAKIGE